MSDTLIGIITGAILALVAFSTGLILDAVKPMNYFEGRVLVHLIGSLEPSDRGTMSVDLLKALGKNGNISQYEFDCLFRDAARLKYGP
jgi:hypothetical protein